MIHGHEILHMMEGNIYNSKKELIQAIHERFGYAAKFRTCHAENLSAEAIVDFFEQHDKLLPTETGFTVNSSNICQH